MSGIGAFGEPEPRFCFILIILFVYLKYFPGFGVKLQGGSSPLSSKGAEILIYDNFLLVVFYRGWDLPYLSRNQSADFILLLLLLIIMESFFMVFKDFL